MNKNKIYIVAGILIIVGIVVLALLLKFNSQNTEKSAPPSEAAPAARTNDNGGAQKNSNFMEKIQQKAEENKKNYDTSLTEFAQKRWGKLFQEQNGPSDGLKIASQAVSKEADGSTIYRVNFSYNDNQYSDFFYLMLSEAKLKELGLNDLSANRFLSEQELKKYINQPNFAKISKINK